MTDMQRALARMEFAQRENLISHLPYEQETRFYRAIQRGDSEAVAAQFTPLCQEGFGVLSRDAMRNLTYHLIITVAFVTRYCIEGGMDAETAYNLSDLYIQRIDVARTQEEIHALHREVVFSFTERMKALAARPPFSRPVMRCARYIHTHLHQRITAEELCADCGLSRTYLSRLFREEVGVTITQYILEKKLDEAKRLLESTSLSVSAVANTLAFSSESHFISVFRRQSGLTPKEYRRRASRLSPENDAFAP